MKRGKKSTKRLNVSKFAKLANKKKDTWVVRTDPGPHPKDKSIPLSLIIRDLLGYAQNLKEVKMILADGYVLVDGKTAKDYRMPIGLMDIVSFPKQETMFRMVINRQGKLIALPVKELGTKLTQIKTRYVQKGGKITVMLHDNRNIIVDKDYAVGDSLIIAVPHVKIEGHIPLKEGSLCYVTKGKHIGSVAKVVEFKLLGMGRTQVKLESDDGSEFYTVRRYLFPIDDVKTVKG